MKGRGIEGESERKKIERKRRFLLQFLLKYPEWRSGKQSYIYYSFSVTKLQISKEKSLNLKSYINRVFTSERECTISGKSPKQRNKA